MTHHWHRTQSIDSGWRELHHDDWSLVDDDTGEVLARVFDTETPDILGSWRWWRQPFYEIDNIGSAQAEAEAKQLAEERMNRT
jgi:hypothetical protein